MKTRSINSIVAALCISIVSNLLSVRMNSTEAAPAKAKAEQSKGGKPVNVTSNDAIVATEKFGLHLFQKLSTEKSGENCFISPASVAIALNFAMAGSNGATRAAMTKGLGFNVSEAETAAAFNELIKQLASKDDQVEMNIANAIFVNEKFKLNSAFEETARSDFQSEVRNENFADKQTLNKINSWVSDKTKKHIPSIINDLSPQAFAVLLNAIYFKGAWSTPFPVANSKPGDFHLANGDTKKVTFMSDSGKYQYFEETDFQAVKLPYGKERYEALVFLPAKTLTLAEFQKRLTPANLDSYVTKFDTWKNSHLMMPRFHIDYSKKLNDALGNLGFGNMFTDSADFSRIHTPPPGLKVSEVIHKTTLDVDEKGTVATAATSVTLMPTAVRLEKPKRFDMIVDRPFIFAIRDAQTGLLIFIGTVYSPEKPAN